MARVRRARVGIVVECGRDGVEDVLCRRICELLTELSGVALDIDIVPMVNKANLIEACGTAAAALIADGCNRVVILWDERPAWPKMDDPLCWHHDRAAIVENLRQSGVARHLAHLVCIEREFESWLLHDERMLSAVLSTKAHPVQVPPQKHPHRMRYPKGTMISLFQRYRGLRYVDIQHARAFAQSLQDLNRLRRCDTFRRFAQCVLGQMPSGWLPYRYTPRGRGNP